MPYKRKGRIIYHLKNGKWEIKQRCQNIENAKATLRFLNGIEHGIKPKR